MKAKLLTNDPYNKGLVSLHWVPHHKYTQEGKRCTREGHVQNGQREPSTRHFLRTQRITPTIKKRRNITSMMVVIQVAMPVDGLSWRPSKGGGKVSCIGGVRSPKKEEISNIATLLK